MRWAAPISAVLLIFSFPVFPDFQLSPLVWIGLVPLLCRLLRACWREAVLLGAAFGYPFIIGILAWVKWFGIAPWLALCFFEGAWFIGFALLVALAAPAWSDAGLPNETPRPWTRHLAAITLPGCAWILIEWMRSLGTLSIPWGNLSHTQVGLPALVSTARWWGAYGVSFWIVAVNSAAANVLISRKVDRWRAAAASACTAALVPLAALTSIARMPAAHGRPVRVALIQGNLSRESTATVAPDPAAFREEALSTYISMSKTAARQHPDLIVWPETVVPAPGLLLDPALLDAVAETARETKATMVVGSPHFTQEGPYNSAFVLSPQGRVLGRYDKEHLVPFGEYTPFLRSFFERYGAPEEDLVRGQGHQPVLSPLGSLGIMICYESMYPQIARQTVRHGAELLVVVTNDQWFGNSSAPYDHAANAPFRAAETGRWLVQAGTTGISLFADPGGHEYRATRMYTRAIDSGPVYSRDEITLYTRLGDWPPLVAGAVLLVVILVTRARRRRNGDPEPCGVF